MVDGLAVAWRYDARLVVGPTTADIFLPSSSSSSSLPPPPPHPHAPLTAEPNSKWQSATPRPSRAVWRAHLDSRADTTAPAPPPNALSLVAVLALVVVSRHQARLHLRDSPREHLHPLASPPATARGARRHGAGADPPPTEDNKPGPPQRTPDTAPTLYPHASVRPLIHPQPPDLPPSHDA